MKVSLPILLLATVGSLALHTAFWCPWPEPLPWLDDLLPEQRKAAPDEQPASSLRVLPRQTPPLPPPKPTTPAAASPVQQIAKAESQENAVPASAQIARPPVTQKPDASQPLRLDVTNAEATLAATRELGLSIVLGHAGSLWRIKLARSSVAEAIMVTPLAPGSVALHRLPTHPAAAPTAYRQLLANAARLADVPPDHSLLAMLEDEALQRAARRARDQSQASTQPGGTATNGRIRFTSQPQARVVWLP